MEDNSFDFDIEDIEDNLDMDDEDLYGIASENIDDVTIDAILNRVLSDNVNPNEIVSEMFRVATLWYSLIIKEKKEQIIDMIKVNRLKNRSIELLKEVGELTLSELQSKAIERMHELLDKLYTISIKPKILNSVKLRLIPNELSLVRKKLKDVFPVSIEENTETASTLSGESSRADTPVDASAVCGVRLRF